MTSKGWFCIWVCPLILACGLFYCLGMLLTLQISQPHWYIPYKHSLESPVELRDSHFPEMFSIFLDAYPIRTSPSQNFNLGYDHIEFPTTEEWINPRTNEKEIMKLRGWYIGFHHQFNEISNVDRVVQLMKEENKNSEEIDQFIQQSKKKEGIIGIHGAGMDRRELLR